MGSFSLGGRLKSLARIFSPSLALKLSGFARILLVTWRFFFFFFFFFFFGGGVPSLLYPPPPRLVRLWSLYATRLKIGKFKAYQRPIKPGRCSNLPDPWQTIYIIQPAHLALAKCSCGQTAPGFLVMISGTLLNSTWVQGNTHYNSDPLS